MVVEKLFGFKKELDSEGIVFCYSGPVSQGLVEEIGDVIKRKMELEDATLAIVQKVFGIFVEQIQNIMNYSADSRMAESGNTEMRSGIIVIGKKEMNFYVLSGNLIENRKN